MITATYKGQYLELSEDLQIEKVRKSQLLSFDKLKGDHVPSFSVKNTARNRNILNHPNCFELERSGKLEYEDFIVRKSGWIVIAGTFVIEEGSKDQFDGYVRGVTGNLSSTSKEKSIKDFDLPTAVPFVSKNYYDPGTDDYCCFTLKNEFFFKDIGKIRDEDKQHCKLQQMHSNIGFEVNRYLNGEVVTNDILFDYVNDEMYDLTIVSPFLFLFNILEKVLQEELFFINRNDIETDSELKSIAIYNTYDITENATAYLVIQPTSEFDGYVTLTTTSKKISTIQRSINSFDYKNLLPDVSLKSFLIDIQNSFNLSFVFNEDNTYDIVDRESVLIGESIDLDQYLVQYWVLKTKKNVCLKFTQKHDDQDKYFSDFFVDLSDRANDFGEPVATESDLENIAGSFLGELRVVANHKVFEWSFEVVATEQGEEDVFAWKFISNMFQPYLYNYKEGREVEEIKTNFSTLYMQSGFPTVMQKGQSELRKSEGGEFSPRLMFYQGAGFASNESETNYSFDYSSDLALPRTRFKYFNKFWAFRQPVEAKFDLPINVLFNFDINKKYRTRHGEFLIEEMTTPISHNKVGETIIKGYKVDFEDENTD